MQISRKLGVLAAFGLSVAAASFVSGQEGGAEQQAATSADWARAFDGSPSFTKPSADAVMGFSIDTTVTETLVIGGEQVEEGQVLIRGEDGEQLALLDQTRMRFESDLELRRATKEAALAEVEYQRAQEGFDGGGVSPRELDRARLTWETAVIGVETAEFNNRLEQSRLQQARALLDRYRLVAPFPGVIEEVYRGPGTSVQRGDPVLRVVKIEPLWIDVPVPTQQTLARKLAPGDEAWVLLDTPGGGYLGSGEVIEISPVADFASGTRRVRVELPNPGRLPPGLRCWTRFDAPEGEWADAWSGKPEGALPPG